MKSIREIQMKRRLLDTLFLLVLTGYAAGQSLENATLRLEVEPNGRVTIRDKRSNLVWRQADIKSVGIWPKGGPITGGPMHKRPPRKETCPRIVHVTKAKDAILISAEWHVPLVFRWSLAGGNAVRLSVDSPHRDEKIEGGDEYWGPRLLYPTAFFAQGASRYTVMPDDEGVIYSTSETDPEADHVRFLTKSLANQLSMPWWGVTDLRRGVMTRVDTPFHVAEKMAWCDTPGGERTLPAIMWLTDRGCWAYERKVTFRFINQGGYVAMAKQFRNEMIAAGRFRTLKEKAKLRPAVSKLRGAMDLWVFNLREERKVVPLTGEDIRKIHGYGFKHLLLHSFGGTEPTPGGGFAPEAVKEAHRLGWLVGQYHLRSWIYKKQAERNPELEGMCIRGPTDYRYRPSPWGPHLFYCPAVLGGILKSVARDERAYGLDAFFTDTTTAGGSVRDCYDPKHPLTKSAATRALAGALTGVSDTGMVIGSERGFWWAAADCDYFEGIETTIGYFSAFIGPEVPLRHAGPFRTKRKGYDKYMLGYNYGPQNRVPLFQLVFHDAVVCLRRWNDHQPRDPRIWRRSDLMSIIYGTPPIACFHHQAGPHILRDDYAPLRDRYARTFRDVCGWHEKIGFEEMTSHRFLSPDRMVQETTFGNGLGVVVNFAQGPWKDPRGFAVPPMGFVCLPNTAGPE